MPKVMRCRICQEEFQLQLGKPGLANECPRCIAEKSIYIDPLNGCSGELRAALYRECANRGLEGEARDHFLRQWMRDLKDL